METQMRENHGMFFYILEYDIHRKHQLPNSPTPTGRRLQSPVYILHLKEYTTPQILHLQLERDSNPLIYRIQPKGSSNFLYSPAPTRRRL
jgi:hypothetical protein